LRARTAYQDFEQVNTEARVYQFPGAEAAQELGINDPMAHVELWRRQGEAAIPQLRAEIIDTVAEMLLHPFKNRVDFEYDGQDFVSVNEGVRMKQMTATTRYITNQLAENRPGLNEQLTRADIEYREPYLVEKWFQTAQPNEILFFVSPPLLGEKYAIGRGYQKTAPRGLSEHIIALHNPHMAVFNRQHEVIGAPVPPAKTPLEQLNMPYVLEIPEGVTTEEFLDYWVDAYDSSLEEFYPGREFTYGVDGLTRSEFKNGRDKISEQTHLQDIYIRAVAQAAEDHGSVTRHQQRARLREVIQDIASVVDRAEPELLDRLIAEDAAPEMAYAATAFYGEIRREEQVVYSGGCPTIDPASPDRPSETSILARGYRIDVISSLIREHFDSQWCPNCLPRKQPGKKVKAWRQGSVIGCYNCGQREDVCLGVIKRGRKISDTKIEPTKTVRAEKHQPLQETKSGPPKPKSPGLPRLRVLA